MSSEEQDDKKPPGLLRRLAALPSATVALTALIALIAAATGLAFDIWPGLKPDPRTQLGADLTVTAVERNVSRGESIRRRSGSPEHWVEDRAEFVADKGERALATRGEMVLVNVAVHGFKRREVILRGAVYDARTRERVMESSVAIEVGLEAPTDKFVAEMWVDPRYGLRRRYFVRVEAREEGHGTLLAVADSDPFRGLPFPKPKKLSDQ